MAVTPLHSEPLADRMRPRTLDQVVGQPQVASQSAALRQAIAAGRPPSVLLWGPPGSGKTTIAEAIAHEVDAAFERLSAVTSGIRDLRAVIERSEERAERGEATILFVDEVHRWNKNQQDALLPHVEHGTVIFVGATTENPGYEVNSALLSRCKVLRLGPLDDEAMIEIARRCFTDADHGLAFPEGDPRALYELTDQARDLLLLHAAGDARVMLGAIEVAAALQPDGGELGVEVISSALGRRQLSHDKSGDSHYNLLSALIKSIRGSDPSAATYWLARLELGGEDPKTVARRLIVSASEEIGTAAAGALAVAVAGFDAVERVGAPECWINLAQVVCYLAQCPKSWASYQALHRARELVYSRPAYPVPLALRNANTKLDREAGHGEGYVHASQPGAERMTFLPTELRGERIYRPQGSGQDARAGGPAGTAAEPASGS